MRIKHASKVLFDAFALDDLPRVFDIGASPLSRPAYAPMLGEGRCAVWGFEPQPEQFERLKEQASKNETYFPNAIGAGGEETLHVYRNPGFTSLYPIRDASIAFLGRYWRATRLLEQVPLATTKLDDIDALPLADLLKVDVQGAETDIFKSGERVLSKAVAVIPEVRFYPLYEGEPTFGDLHNALSDQGFRLHKFLSTKQIGLRHSQEARMNMAEAGSQLVDGDAVYIRPPESPDSLDVRQLKCLALFATEVFRSIDLAVKCLDMLVEKGAVTSTLPQMYVDALPNWLRAVEPA